MARSLFFLSAEKSQSFKAEQKSAEEAIIHVDESMTGPKKSQSRHDFEESDQT